MYLYGERGSLQAEPISQRSALRLRAQAASRLLHVAAAPAHVEQRKVQADGPLDVLEVQSHQLHKAQPVVGVSFVSRVYNRSLMM